MRVHHARQLARNANKEVYAPGDAMHGVSEYDRLTLRIREGEGCFYVYLEHAPALEGVESLSEVEDHA
jgi:hypothetical protein